MLSTEYLLKMVKIINIDSGIASRIKNIIYINKDLKDYNYSLYQLILNHELEHTFHYSLKDFLLDVRTSNLEGYRLKYWKFILTHPKSWTEFLPIMKLNGKTIINPSLIILYGLFLIISGSLLIALL